MTTHADHHKAGRAALGGDGVARRLTGSTRRRAHRAARRASKADLRAIIAQGVR